MKKRLLSLMLVFAMVLGMVPMTALASDNEAAEPIGVFMTFADNGQIVEVEGEKLFNAEVEVSDVNADGKLTIGEAFAAFHEQWYDGEDGYAETDTETLTGWVTKFWGKAATGFSYALNNGWARSTQDEIKAGDLLSVYFAQSGSDTNYCDLLTWFEEAEYTAEAGTAMTFAVSGVSIMKSGEVNGEIVNATAVPEGAAVTVYDSTGAAVADLATTTDAEGKFSVTFSAAGEYTVMVSGTCGYTVNGVTTTNAPVVPTCCKVTVEAVEEPENAINLSASCTGYDVTFAVGNATVEHAAATPDGKNGVLELVVTDVGESGKVTVTANFSNLVGYPQLAFQCGALNVSSGSASVTASVLVIINGQPRGEAGKWTVKVTVADYEEPATIALTTDLSEDEVKYTAGDTAATLTVAAQQSKGEAVTYQWYKNTVKSTEGAAAIEGATEASYMPDTANAGTAYYYAVATCGKLSVTSRIATITVKKANEIILEAGNEQYTVSFAVEGATVVSAAPTVSGYSGTMELVVKEAAAGGRVKVTPTVAGYEIDTDVWYIEVDVSDGSGKNTFDIYQCAGGFPVSKLGTWTVNVTVADYVAPATIAMTTDLSEAEVKYTVGDTAVALNVAAQQSKGEAVTYQWYKNTVKSTDGAAAIDGATGASYMPDTANAGTAYYYAVATCGDLSVTSKIATVTVEEAAQGETNEPYVIYESSSDKYFSKITLTGAKVLEKTGSGQTITLLLDASTPVNGVVTIAAAKGTYGSQINQFTGAGDIHLVNGEAQVTLYAQRYVNTYSSTWNITLKVDVSGKLPEITTDLSETAVKYDLGDTAESLTVVAEHPKGEPLTYQWYRNTAKSTVGGTAIAGATGTSYTPATTAQGTTYYYVEVSAGGFIVPSKVATVTVVDPNATDTVLVEYATGNGSVDSVRFADANGNPIPVAGTVEGTTINVTVPRSLGVNSQIKAIFSLTQNATQTYDGKEYNLPLLTSKTATAGTSSNRWYNGITNEYTTTLSNGKGSVTAYLTDSAVKKPSFTSIVVKYSIANAAPVLVDASTAEAEITVGENYTLDLTKVFKDNDEGDNLTYKVSVDGGTAVTADAAYRYTNDVGGTYTLVFTAYDAMNTASEPYTVTLTVGNSKITYDVTVNMPDDTAPVFYSRADAQEGSELTAEQSGTVFTVKVPENIRTIAWRYDGMGMNADVSADNNTLTVYKTRYEVKAGENTDNLAEVIVKYGGMTALGKGNTYLLLSTGVYDITAKPSATYSGAWFDLSLAGQSAVDGTVTLDLKSRDVNFTVPYFADLYVCAANERQGTPTTEIQPTKVGTTDFASGTRTDAYNLKNGTVYEYRVSVPADNVNCDQYVTFVGMFKKTDTTTQITVTKAQIEDGGNGRTTIDHELEPYSNGTLDSANVADLYMNVNAQGYLKLNKGQTKDLYTARAWWATNCGGWAMNTYRFLEPDYHYTVVDLNGQPSSGIISVNEKGKITAEGEGTAIVLVTYDAMNVDIEDKLYQEAGPEKPYNDGFFSAIWPENTGVFVVSVGAEDSGINTGMTINTDKSIGSKTAGYNMDAEHDVIYFLGDKGEYTFTPATEGVTVSVANPAIIDGALTFSGFTALEAAEDGSVTVPLTFGRNIVKVEKDGKAEYQVITAKQVTATVNGVPLEEAVVAPGDTVSIVFDTLYNPVNRLGIYNTGAAVIYSEVSGWEGKTAGNFSGGMGFYFFASNVPHQTVANFNKVGNDGSSYGNYAVNLGDTLTVPENFAEPYFTLSGGNFYVSGFSRFRFGDHRTVLGQQPGSGSSNNIYAYFGRLPDISIPTAALDSIAVTVQPATTEYALGDVFDPAGMEVTATFTNAGGTFDKVITDYTYDAEAFTASGTRQVEISYTFNGVTKTTTVEVTVGEAELERIEVTRQPDKIAYRVGETFDPAGMEVTAYYADGTAKTVTEYTCAPDTLSKGDKEVTVTYGDKNTAVAVTVILVERIEIAEQPNKVEYTAGDLFDPKGMVVVAVYGDGTEEVTEHYTFAPSKKLSVSDDEITVTYTGDDAADGIAAVTVEITVKAKPSSPSVPDYDYIKVYMTFVDEGEIIVYDEVITVYDEDEDGIYTIGDAFAALHEEHYRGGADGYAEVSNANVTGWVSMFWGERTSSFSYLHNYSWASSTLNEIKNRDTISAFNGEDEVEYADLFTWFDESGYSAVVGMPKTFTVNGINVMGSGPAGDLLAVPKGADVTVYDINGREVKALATTVDEDGRFELKFTASGTYTVEVSGTADYAHYRGAPVVPSRCTVAVSSDSSSGSGNADRAKAREVVDLIDEIGTVDENSKDAIEAARKAYNKLNEAQKALVSNYDDLVSAEKKYAKLTDKTTFSDVKKDDFFYDAVYWAVNAGITNGVGADLFAPNASCSRAQMVTFLWRAAGMPKAKSSSCPFTDVDRNAYYYEALLWAVENGITTGTGSNTFSPDANCSRAQMVTFLWRAAGEAKASSTSCAFADVKSNAYYYEALLWAVENGITTGTGSNTFSPDAHCTRGQTVTFLYRSANGKKN